MRSKVETSFVSVSKLLACLHFRLDFLFHLLYVQLGLINFVLPLVEHGVRKVELIFVYFLLDIFGALCMHPLPYIIKVDLLTPSAEKVAAVGDFRLKLLFGFEMLVPLNHHVSLFVFFIHPCQEGGQARFLLL